jgi:methionine aminopeptidase
VRAEAQYSAEPVETAVDAVKTGRQVRDLTSAIAEYIRIPPAPRLERLIDDIGGWLVQHECNNRCYQTERTGVNHAGIAADN